MCPLSGPGPFQEVYGSAIYTPPLKAGLQQGPQFGYPLRTKSWLRVGVALRGVVLRKQDTSVVNLMNIMTPYLCPCFYSGKRI